MPENDVGSDIRGPAVVDLLGMLSLAELLAFDRMAADARLAPDLRRRAILSEMAAMGIANYRRLADRILSLGTDPEEAMAPFTTPLRAYHDQTRPADWYEGLAKAHIGDAIADDFAREVARHLGGSDRELVVDVLSVSPHATFVVEELASGIQADSRLADRLSMWARRLVGEGLSQAVRVASERPALAALLTESANADGGIPAMFKRLTTAHVERMAAIGLNS